LPEFDFHLLIYFAGNDCLLFLEWNQKFYNFCFY